MKSVRVEVASGKVLLVDITCDCGRNGLKDVATGESSFKHSVLPGTSTDTWLKCDGCGAQYTLHQQHHHIHISRRG